MFEGGAECRGLAEEEVGGHVGAHGDVVVGGGGAECLGGHGTTGGGES